MCNFETLLNDRLNDRLTKISTHAFERHVEKLAEEVRIMRAALQARDWFYREGPRWAPPLPLCACEFEKCYTSGYFELHLLGWYSESLAARDYDYLDHPLFFDYARGVLAAGVNADDSMSPDEEDLRQFPPKRLPGLDAQKRWRPLAGRGVLEFRHAA